MDRLEQIGYQAKETERYMRTLSTARKNEVLNAAADALVKFSRMIMEANHMDVEAGWKKGMHEGLIDRLMLTEQRIESMADGLRSIAALEDPVGEVINMKQRPNGLMIGQKRVPLGVVGIIWIFLTQESKQGLLHHRQILYQLSYQGSPYLRG